MVRAKIKDQLSEVEVNLSDLREGTEKIRQLAKPEDKAMFVDYFTVEDILEEYSYEDIFDGVFMMVYKCPTVRWKRNGEGEYYNIWVITFYPTWTEVEDEILKIEEELIEDNCRRC